MNETTKRPTREEAMRAVGILPGDPQNISCSTRRAEIVILNRTAELFGGFAPGPVEVPRLGCLDRGDTYGSLLVAEPNPAKDTDYRHLKKEESIAVIARSGAWEEIRADLRELICLIAAQPLLGERGRREVEGILGKMSAPEMGVGPK